MKVRLSHEGRELEVELLQTGDKRSVTLDGKPVTADVRWIDDRILSLIVDGRSYELVPEANGSDTVTVVAPARRFTLRSGDRARGQGSGGSGTPGSHVVSSPMPGKIVEVLVQAGQRVEAGQGLVVVEAMKMENELAAHADGVVTAVRAEKGEVVEAGVVLVEVGPCSS